MGAQSTTIRVDYRKFTDQRQFLNKVLDSKVTDKDVEDWSKYYREDVAFDLKTKQEAREKLKKINEDLLESWYWTAARHVKDMTKITDKVTEIPDSLSAIDMPDHKSLKLSKLDHVKLNMSKAEILARNFYASLFKQMDTDGDGKISFEEFVANRTKGKKVVMPAERKELRTEFDKVDVG